MDIRCKHCNRYMFKAMGTVVIEDLPCPKCGAHLNLKIINDHMRDITHKFINPEQLPTKEIKNEA